MLELLTVSTRGQVTIPAAMREKYGIKAGDKIIWQACENGLTLKKPVDFFQLEGCFSLGHLPDDEEELLTPEMGRHIMERE
jgi:AbrB family looped-hinge helix DNA binding protein